MTLDEFRAAEIPRVRPLSADQACVAGYRLVMDAFRRWRDGETTTERLLEALMEARILYGDPTAQQPLGGIYFQAKQAPPTAAG